MTKRTLYGTISKVIKDKSMVKVMTASQVRTNIYKIMDETAESHEPIIITGKRNNVVMISEEDWNAIEETLYLNSIPGMAKSIQDAMASDDSEFSDTVEW